MKNVLKKYIFLLMLLGVSGLLITSCKQVIVVRPTELVSPTGVSADLHLFIFNMLKEGAFWFWLVVYAVGVLLIKKQGYSFFEWLKGRSFLKKLLIMIAPLMILYVVGCIPQDLQEQYYGRWFALPVICFLISLWLLCSPLKKNLGNQRDGKDNTSLLPNPRWRQIKLQMLARLMFFVWSCGWVLFFIAIGIKNQPHAGTELLLRSAICSFDLFLLDVDSNIVDLVKDHDLLKGLILCVGFTAMLCTALLIVSLVFARLMAYLHVRHIRIDDRRNHLYVFFGLNDASRQLADNICEKDSNAVIVYVETSLAGEVEQDEDKTDGWKNIVSMFTHRRKTFLDAHEDDRHALAIASCSVCNLEMEEMQGRETVNVWDCVGLSSVKKLLVGRGSLSEAKNAKLHLFFLSEDRDANVRAVSKITKDETINNVGYPTTIYCHARRDGVNRIIEDMGLKKKIEIKLLDSSHLAVEHLKRDVRNHPVSFVDVETIDGKNPGAVTSSFVSLVVGFGETGQEAVQFLYEFGAFVNRNASAKHSFRSPFFCHVVDNNMENLEGRFIASIPNVSCRKSDRGFTGSVNFYKCDYRSVEFYERVLTPIAASLNYVVVAMGDDELNMTVAVEILRYVRLHRNNLDKFCIYVRAYEKGTFKHLKDIAKHYNDRLDIKTDEDKKIKLFGQNQEIYTYDLVVKDQYEDKGREYYEAYRGLQIDPDNDEGDWEKRRNDTLFSKKGTKWMRMSKLRRKEGQDRSNALHAATKLRILEKALGGEEELRELSGRMLSYSLDGRVYGERSGRRQKIRYTSLSIQENKLILNMAMLEHLRWNAAHEMMGYMPNECEHACNELTRRHNCLKPWEKLDEESELTNYPVDFKLFDFGVVETTLKQAFFSNKEKDK